MQKLTINELIASHRTHTDNGNYCFCKSSTKPPAPCLEYSTATSIKNNDNACIRMKEHYLDVEIVDNPTEKPYEKNIGHFMKIQDEEGSEIYFSYTQRKREKDAESPILLNKNSKIRITKPYTKCMDSDNEDQFQICCFTYDGNIEQL